MAVVQDATADVRADSLRAAENFRIRINNLTATWIAIRVASSATDLTQEYFDPAVS